MNYKDYSFVSTSNAYFSYELHLHLFDPIVSDSSIYDAYDDSLISLPHVSTQLQVADILTNLVPCHVIGFLLVN
ncbi:hypothetical protein MTR_4g029100 [Medicago truncatula]|uniref:Uncharacterized protein n=1 Tax=Medicago truncatula TaxID=3880 RepID=A0A072UJD3_MEDTR|nr:hypothetical protein MTR_4g029100 [Medicago truncatula]